MDWPESFAALVAEQERLAALEPPPWSPLSAAYSGGAYVGGAYSTGGCFVCFPRGHSGPGATGDPAWAGAALIESEGSMLTAWSTGIAGGPYRPGLLALREGPLLESAVRALPSEPDVLLVNATGRDHPREAGLALHLGALLEVPTVGVTHRPLLAVGDWPGTERGDHRPLILDGKPVGHWLRTRTGRRPLAVHAAWRTTPELAVGVVLATTAGRYRTPEPLRQARRIARQLRATAVGR